MEIEELEKEIEELLKSQIESQSMVDAIKTRISQLTHMKAIRMMEDKTLKQKESEG